MTVHSPGSAILTMTAAEAIAAIRLALAGAADDRTAVRVIRVLLEDAPESDPLETESVHRLIEAIHRSGCAITVKDDA